MTRSPDTSSRHTAPQAAPSGPAADAPAGVGRRARLTWASEIEPEPVSWAWEPEGQGRIPAGSLTVAAGREGTGKSSFGIWMAAQITRGLLPGAFHGQVRTVLYVAVEDSWKHTLVPRLIAAGADLTKVARFDVVTELDRVVQLSLPVDNDLLEQTIVHDRVALIVVDPLMSVISERIDTHRERQVRQVLDPVAGIADRTGAVVMGIAHFGKGGHADAASLITGSGAFKNVPRSVFGFAPDDTVDDDRGVVTQVKNSLGRRRLPSLSYRVEEAEIPTPAGVARTGRFVFLGESQRSVEDILRESRASEGESQAERTEAAEWLRGYLVEQGGSAKFRDILTAARADGIAESTLKRARSKAGVTFTRVGYKGGSVWSLEPADPHSAHSDQATRG
ncbi:AAA family ATPase [Streptomyces sp. ID05-26A]|nr:AAA family ATPase [Streptomyces sp. ID05-26A]